MANKPIDKEYLLQTLKDFDSVILKNSYIEKYDTYAKLPTPASTIEGKIVQWVGADDVTHGLINGFFYECKESATTAGTYEWVEKAVMSIPDGIEYSIVRESTPDTGYFATYQLYGQVSGGTPAPIVGSTKINIPKDYLVKSGTVDTVTAADKAVGGKFENDPNFQIGDKYIDFVVNVKDPAQVTDEHIYINVKDLVDVYTGGDGVAIDASNVISVDVASAGGLELTGTSPNKQVGIKIDNTTPDQMTLHLGASGLYGSLLLADPDDPNEAIDFNNEW